MPNETEQLVTRLVAIHGEEGVCPGADDWRAILGFAADRPLRILNLLRFRDRVATPEGEITGAEAYGRYAAGNAGAFARNGGERIFYGAVGHMFAFGEAAEWDAAILTRYPSPGALAAMWLDEEFIAAHADRLDGVERSQVMVFGR